MPQDHISIAKIFGSEDLRSQKETSVFAQLVDNDFLINFVVDKCAQVRRRFIETLEFDFECRP